MTAENYELKFKYTHEGIEGFDKAAGGVKNVNTSMLALIPIAGQVAVGIAAAAAGMVAFVKGQADAQRQLAVTSASLGITAQQGQQVQFAFNAVGVSMDVMQAASRQLNNRNLETERTLKALGVATTDITGRQRAAGAVFLETASKLSRITNEFERSRTAANAFGAEAAAALDPLLRSGQLLGPALDEGLTKNLENARLQIAQLDAEWERFKTTFGGALAPIVIPIIAGTRNALTGPAAQGNAATASGLAREFAAGRDDNTINLSASGILGGAVSGAGGVASSFISSDLAAGASFSRSFGANSADGLRARRSIVSAKISALSQRLASGTIGGDSFRIQKAELDQLAGELATIEARLKALSSDPNAGALKLSDLQRPGGVGRPGLPPSLFRPFETFTSPEGDRLGLTSQELQGNQNRAFGEGLIQSGRDRTERALERARTILDLETRRVQLTAGPGGEEDAVRRITQMKLEALDRQIALGADIQDAELERYRIAKEGENELFELQRRRAEQYRDFFGAAVLASISKDGGGLSGFGKQQLRALQGQFSTNLGVEIFNQVGPILGKATGGKDGSTGVPILDRLLGGTIFDPKNSATDRNTKALDRLTAAVTAASGGGFGRGFVGSGSPDAIMASVAGGLGAAGLPDPMSLASQGAADTLANTTIGPNGVPIIGTGASWAGNNRGFGNQYGSRGATAAVYGAAAVGGYLGIKSGVQQGGARGTLNAVAAGAGAFAAISPEPVSKAVAAAVAATAALVSSVLPDPKDLFSQTQDKLLKERVYQAPEGLNITQDFNTGGTTAGYGFRGGAPRIVINVSTMDAKSFIERSFEIGEATRVALGTNPALRAAVAELPFTG